MKGIIFVVWEKYLGERFGDGFLDNYRTAMGESKQNLPVTGKTYPDKMLLEGLELASKASNIHEDTLMFEYGRYFMINGLVEYLCGYLLAQAWCGYDLLLLMRDAHAQMRRTPDGVTPPLFTYEVLSNDHNHMILTYDSTRKLCSLLDGCIHGSAQRFGETAHTRELSCMKRGDKVCRFEVLFEGESWAKRATPEVIESEKQRLSKQGLSNLVLQALSHHEQESKTLSDIKILVDQNQGPYFPEIYKEQRHLAPVHISQLHTTLTKLQQVGLVASTINRPEDTFLNRRYWRTRTSD